MRLFRGMGGSIMVEPTILSVTRVLPLRRPTAEAPALPRCPRCGGELVPRLTVGEAGFRCHCPVRRGLVA